MNPSYDNQTLAAYFQPVGDVDRSQIRDALALSPEERFRRAFALAGALAGYQHVAA